MHCNVELQQKTHKTILNPIMVKLQPIEVHPDSVFD